MSSVFSHRSLSGWLALYGWLGDDFAPGSDARWKRDLASAVGSNLAGLASCRSQFTGQANGADVEARARRRQDRPPPPKTQMALDSGELGRNCACLRLVLASNLGGGGGGKWRRVGWPRRHESSRPIRVKKSLER